MASDICFGLGALLNDVARDLRESLIDDQQQLRAIAEGMSGKMEHPFAIERGLLVMRGALLIAGDEGCGHDIALIERVDRAVEDVRGYLAVTRDKLDFMQASVASAKARVSLAGVLDKAVNVNRDRAVNRASVRA